MEPTDLETGVDPMEALIGALGSDEADTTGPAGEEEATAQQDDAAAATTEPTDEAPALVDFDGKKLEIPQGTPPALVEAVTKLGADLKADYTKKTQEIAEQRKAIEQKSEAIQAQHKLLSANLEKTTELRALQERLSQFEGIDWDQLADADPAQATKLNLAYQRAQRQAQQVYSELQHGQAQQKQLEHQQLVTSRAEAHQELQKRLPSISEADKAQMIKAASVLGAEESHMFDPVFLHALHKAAQWDKLQADKPKALQKVVDAPKVLRPGPSAERKPNQAAYERLKSHGRLEDLASLL